MPQPPRATCLCPELRLGLQTALWTDVVLGWAVRPCCEAPPCCWGTPRSEAAPCCQGTPRCEAAPCCRGTPWGGAALWGESVRRWCAVRLRRVVGDHYVVRWGYGGTPCCGVRLWGGAMLWGDAAKRLTWAARDSFAALVPKLSVCSLKQQGSAMGCLGLAAQCTSPGSRALLVHTPMAARSHYISPWCLGCASARFPSAVLPSYQVFSWQCVCLRAPQNTAGRESSPFSHNVCEALKWGIKPFVSNYIWQSHREFRTKSMLFFCSWLKALDLISKRQRFQHTSTSRLETNCREKTKKMLCLDTQNNSLWNKRQNI